MYYSFRPNAALKWDLVNSNLELGLDDNVGVESKSFNEGDGEAAILKSEKQLTTYDVTTFRAEKRSAQASAHP